jgi:hypothetical protein
MMSGLQVGDPADEATDIGPIVAQRQQHRVQGYIRLDEGARIVVGGDDSPYDRGWYVRPTLFADATNQMRIAREEIFGPVLTVLKYSDEREAVRIANDSDYGLAGSVWTADTAHGLQIAEAVRTGTYASRSTTSTSPARSAVSNTRASDASSPRRASARRRVAVDGERRRLAAIGASARLIVCVVPSISIELVSHCGQSFGWTPVACSCCSRSPDWARCVPSPTPTM